MTINLTQAEHSEEITLAYGNGLLDLYREKADNVAFFSRFIPIGSSRNIVYDDYGYTRLQLPSKAKYIDIDVDLYGVIHYAETDAFSGIYPRRIGTISSVRAEACVNDDGDTFYVYYVKDNTLDFDPNDYMMDGLVINMTFQSGDLNGRDFEVNYNSTTEEFEIINQYPYDDSTIQLPGSLLMEEGDTYVLWNLEMPSEYRTLAEIEYKEAVYAFIEENLKDIGIYKGTTDYVELGERDVILTIGQRIRLESTKYFPSTGYRLSRITKLTRNVNYPKKIDIEISDVLSTGTIDKINDDLTEIKNYTEQAVSDLPDVIKSWESTLAADTNLYSAKKSVKEFLSKLNNDTAQGFISFLKGISLGDYILGESGATIDYQGNAELQTAIVRELLSSTKFVDGFTGEGWKVWIDQLTGLSNLTIDKATIRQSLVAFELLIEKVRSVGGQLVVSSANGKIKSVEKDEDEENYIITFEDTNTFEEHDLMRCATFSGDIKGYWVEVLESSSEGIVVAVSEFEDETPVVGDECVLMGNTENALRQNLILIAATEDGQPRIDVLDGVKEKNFNDCLRVRLGSLDGITNTTFPLDHQPSGYGLYGDNVFLKGTFILSTGEDILTQFSVLEGAIQSSVEALKQDVADDTSYLSNATFGNGLNDWETDNQATLFTLADRWLWINGAPYSNKTDYAGVKTDDGRTTVYIKNNYILQKNENFRIIPSYDDKNSDGESLASAIYLVFYYKVKTAGTLTIGFENVDQEGFEAFDMFSYEGDLEAGDSYTTFKHSGLWNGSGDFKLSFTGEINLYMLILSTDAAEALAYKYKTLFEQSEKLIKIAAQNFDEDGNVTQESGILTSASGNQLYAFDADGNLISLIDQTAGAISISADNIDLSGVVTINGKIKMAEDGSLEATDGKFTGEVTASKLVSSGAVIAGQVDVTYSGATSINPNTTSKAVIWAAESNPATITLNSPSIDGSEIHIVFIGGVANEAFTIPTIYSTRPIYYSGDDTFLDAASLSNTFQYIRPEYKVATGLKKYVYGGSIKLSYMSAFACWIAIEESGAFEISTT